MDYLGLRVDYLDHIGFPGLQVDYSGLQLN